MRGKDHDYRSMKIGCSLSGSFWGGSSETVSIVTTSPEPPKCSSSRQTEMFGIPSSYPGTRLRMRISHFYSMCNSLRRSSSRAVSGSRLHLKGRGTSVGGAAGLVGVGSGTVQRVRASA